MNDDVFDFFYEALPGYEEVGRRRILLGCWGRSTTPRTSTTTTATWTTGATRCSSPRAWSSTASSSPRTWSTSTSASASCSAAPTTRTGRARRRSSTKDPLGNPVDKRHPWNQTTIPKPQKRDLEGGNYSWVMSPRWYDQRTGDHLALDTGGGALARLWATALASKVDTPYVQATGGERARSAAADAGHAGDELEWKIPQWSNAIERDRARTTSSPTPRRWRCTSSSRRSTRSAPASTKVFEDFDVPDEAIGCGFHEAVRGVLSHHLVIRDGKIANYHPYPPTPWNGSPTDSFGTPGPYEDAVTASRSSRRTAPDDFRGIDIMRAVRSFDPCLPCGVHMYLGNGRTIKQVHSPMLGAQDGG